MNQLSSDFSIVCSEYPSFYDIYGNVPLDQAQIVCIIDDHDNLETRRRNLALVEAIYWIGLIIVEYTPFGKEIEPSQSVLTQGLQRKLTVKGENYPSCMSK